ncbi:MAG: hypothetical protein A4E62_00808 [Syntrophorhabdus sp. PtaU1.Bin002]|nr:MAG: hypothetical protein A4E58_03133 [Syntrophorhabdus sp. PtaB.Bin006]OPY72549.1 MAG: hypothetical protein A4E62_00808 [Syntrophorhabdus sp. PtaU1.Bin002]
MDRERTVQGLTDSTIRHHTVEMFNEGFDFYAVNLCPLFYAFKKGSLTTCTTQSKHLEYRDGLRVLGNDFFYGFVLFDRHCNSLTPLSKHISGKDVNIGILQLPGILWQTSFVTGVFQEGVSVPVVFGGYLWE